MRNAVFHFAIAVAMTSVFVTMFWVQVGGAVTAAARTKTGVYAVMSGQHMSIQRLEPVYCEHDASPTKAVHLLRAREESWSSG